MGLVDDFDAVKRERIFALVLICFIVVFTTCDVLVDLQEGSTLSHVASELSVITICIFTGVCLWRRVSRSWKSITTSMGSQLASVREDAKRWQTAHASLSKGLIEAIDAQLQDWGLSSAEKDITFLVMKGLTFKEIANLRTTSEHTVRQQAATIYRKSGLEGRSQLAAFFLEDLLTPRS